MGRSAGSPPRPRRRARRGTTCDRCRRSAARPSRRPRGPAPSGGRRRGRGPPSSRRWVTAPMRSRRWLTSGWRLIRATVHASMRAGLLAAKGIMSATTRSTRSATGTRRVDLDRRKVLGAPPQDLGQQVVLGTEVGVGGGGRHAGPPGHAADGQAGVADLLGLVLGRLHQCGHHLGLPGGEPAPGGLEVHRSRRVDGRRGGGGGHRATRAVGPPVGPTLESVMCPYYSPDTCPAMGSRS